MKRLFKLTVLVIVLIIIAGCKGGGGDASNSDASFDTGRERISVALCNNSSPIYTDINTGDLLVKDDELTLVNLIHDSNNNKKVCIISGSAHLVRQKV